MGTFERTVQYMPTWKWILTSYTSIWKALRYPFRDALLNRNRDSARTAWQVRGHRNRVPLICSLHAS